MERIFLRLESLVSGVFPLVFLTICGLIFTLKTGGWQFENLIKSISFSLKPKPRIKGGMSSFSAVCNSLAATVGTGNIAGVAAAITVGGAGSIFWMWIFAFLSMVIKAVEITLSVETKVGQRGGPLVYFKNAFPKKSSAISFVFAGFGIMASFCTGNITQVNATVEAIGGNIYIKLLIGGVFFAVSSFIIRGGLRKIARFTTATVPFMACLYIVFCLGVILENIGQIGGVFLSIIKGAFCPRSVTGGTVGTFVNCVLTGAKKGIFSNEAGLGTAGMAHSQAVDSNPETQGLFGVFEVFVDTVVICTLTALTILSSGVIIDYNKTASSGLVVKCFETVYGRFSSSSLSMMLGLFALSSIIGWAAYGIDFSRFLLGEKGQKIYCFIYPIFCFVGAVTNADTAYRLAEFFGGVMLSLNLFAVFILSDRAVLILKGEKYGKKDKKNTKLFKRG